MSIRQKTTLGQVGIGLVVSIIGGVAIGIFTAVTYVNSTVNDAVTPVANQSQENQTAIAALQATSEDTNKKVDALYNFYLQRGLISQNQLRSITTSTP